MDNTDKKELVHQITRAGVVLCGANPNDVAASRVCQFVDCPECKQKLEELVDVVFQELPE